MQVITISHHLPVTIQSPYSRCNMVGCRSTCAWGSPSHLIPPGNRWIPSTRRISISIVRLLPIRFFLYLTIWAATSQSESCIINSNLRTDAIATSSEQSWDRTGAWGWATVRLNSKRSWSPTHLRLSSWQPTARRLLQCLTCTWLESSLEACRWRCSLLRLGLEGARTMQRSRVDTRLYALFLVV